MVYLKTRRCHWAGRRRGERIPCLSAKGRRRCRTRQNQAKYECRAPRTGPGWRCKRSGHVPLRCELRCTSIQKIFTPCLSANGGSQKFDVTIGHPSAALEVVRCEVLDGRKRRCHLGLVAYNVQPNLTEKKLEGGKEQLDGGGFAGDDPVIKEEGLEVEIPRVLRLRDTYGFDDAGMDGESDKGRPERVSLFHSSRPMNPRAADQQIGVVAVTRVRPCRQLREVFAYG